jgi:hypothetical protein
MRLLLVVLGGVFTAGLAFAAHKEPIRITDGWGVARLYGNVSSREIYDAKADDAFEFIVEEVPAQELARERASIKTWWGADGPKPPLLVKRVSFHIGGRSVAFPLRAYADLGDMFYPPRLRLEQHGRELRLFLSASDAAAGYTATFIIQDAKLIKRIVQLGEFPEERSVLEF